MGSVRIVFFWYGVGWGGVEWGAVGMGGGRILIYFHGRSRMTMVGVGKEGGGEVESWDWENVVLGLGRTVSICAFSLGWAGVEEEGKLLFQVLMREGRGDYFRSSRR